MALSPSPFPIFSSLSLSALMPSFKIYFPFDQIPSLFSFDELCENDTCAQHTLRRHVGLPKRQRQFHAQSKEKAGYKSPDLTLLSLSTPSNSTLPRGHGKEKVHCQLISNVRHRYGTSDQKPKGNSGQCLLLTALGRSEIFSCHERMPVS